jgi:hypothetical protein
VADEEAEAIDDENDLRGAQGLVERDRDRIEGGCGCPDGGCCIVASVAFGTPYAAEINQLRRIRDYKLRSSLIGAAFFEELHREYYAFSIDVCRIMASDGEARANVERGLVRPLADVLAVLLACSEQGGEPEAVGNVFLEMAPLHAKIHSAGVSDTLLEELAEGKAPDLLNFGSGPTAQILDTLAHWLPRSPHVRWGIVQPIRLLLRALARFGQNADPTRVGYWFMAEFERWIGSIPIDDATIRLSPAARSERIHEFVCSVASTPELQNRLTSRLDDWCNEKTYPEYGGRL